MRLRILSVLAAALALTAFALPSDSNQGQILVQNQSSHTIYYIYASPCSSSDWGNDLLGSDVLPSGRSFYIDVVAGCWDLRAEAQNGTVTEARGAQVGAGQQVPWTLFDQ